MTFSMRGLKLAALIAGAIMLWWWAAAGAVSRAGGASRSAEIEKSQHPCGEARSAIEGSSAPR